MSLEIFELCFHFTFLCFYSHAGVSRSASVVIAYVMKSRDLSLRNALDHVKSIKQDVMYVKNFEDFLHRCYLDTSA